MLNETTSSGFNQDGSIEMDNPRDYFNAPAIWHESDDEEEDQSLSAITAKFGV